MSNEIVLKSLKEIRALTDPYRQKIIKTLKRMERPATAKEVADAIGEPPSKVHYHMGVLMEYGIVEQDHTEVIHGITARYLTMTDKNIKIDSEDEADEEILRAVNFFFNQGREEYIHALEGKRKNGIEAKGVMIQRSVYLTKEEADTLEETLKTLNKVPKPDTQRYILFSAIIPGEVE